MQQLPRLHQARMEAKASIYHKHSALNLATLKYCHNLHPALYSKHSNHSKHKLRSRLKGHNRRSKCLPPTFIRHHNRHR